MCGDAGKLPDAEDDKPPVMEVDEGGDSSDAEAVDVEKDDEPLPPPPKPMIGDISDMPPQPRSKNGARGGRDNNYWLC